jgi:NitT/TauT family transport system permease protein
VSVDVKSEASGNVLPAPDDVVRMRGRRRGSGIGRRRRWDPKILASQVALLVVLIVAWELASGPVINEFFFSNPSEIADTLWTWTREGVLWDNARPTLVAAVLGFLIGGSAAVVVGYTLAQSRYLSRVLDPFITALYGTPKQALVPVLVLILGIGQPLQVTVSALITFFLMFYNVFAGVSEVSQHLVDQVRIMGGSRVDLARYVKFPSAMVWVVAGLKLSVPQALVGVVVAEMIAGNAGLGYLLMLNSGQFNAAGTWAALLVLIGFVFIVNRLVGMATRRSLMWKSTP